MKQRTFWLQFFADGAPGGGESGEGGGEGAAVSPESEAGELSLEQKLNIPPEKVETFRKSQKKRASAVPANAAAPAAPAEESAEAAPPAGRMSWEEFMTIPENKERMQQQIRERLDRQERSLRSEQEQTEPMMALLAEHYGIKPKEDGGYDRAAIAKAVVEDERYYEEKANELGISSDVAMRIEQLEREKALNDAARQKAERDEQLRRYFYGVAQQGMELKKTYPDFDLERELQDETFRRLVDPDGKPVTVKQAFWATHGEQLLEQQAEAITRRAMADAAASIRSGVRPRENGASASATAAGNPDLRQMSRKDRLEYIRGKYPSRS